MRTHFRFSLLLSIFRSLFIKTVTRALFLKVKSKISYFFSVFSSSPRFVVIFFFEFSLSAGTRAPARFSEISRTKISLRARLCFLAPRACCCCLLRTPPPPRLSARSYSSFTYLSTLRSWILHKSRIALFYTYLHACARQRLYYRGHTVRRFAVVAV